MEETKKALQPSSYDTAQLYANSQKMNGLSKFHRILPMCFVCNFQERRSFPWPLVRDNSLHISANFKPQVILLSFKKLPLVENKGVEGWHMNDLWVRVDFVKAAFKGIEW